MGIQENLTQALRESFEQGFAQALDRVLERLAETDMVTEREVKAIIEDIKYDELGDDDFANGIAY